jgi:murein L,D-transpeptidase YcbB/YkuD
MNARRFGLRAILLGLGGAAFLGTVATTGTAAAEAMPYSCANEDSSEFARTLPQVRPAASGTYVMGLQRALTNEGYPLVGTGWYGPKTLAAVRDFQAKHGIRNSGTVGQQTWQALVGTKSACLTDEGKPTTPAFGMLPRDRDLNHLATLSFRFQRILPYEAVRLDEEFYGPRWQAVVKNFQRANGIHASGIIGPKTWRALNLVVSISGSWAA